MQAPAAGMAAERTVSHGFQATGVTAPDNYLETGCDWSTRSEVTSDSASRFCSVPTASSATSAAHDSSGVLDDKA